MVRETVPASPLVVGRRPHTLVWRWAGAAASLRLRVLRSRHQARFASEYDTRRITESNGWSCGRQISVVWPLPYASTLNDCARVPGDVKVTPEILQTVVRKKTIL